MDIMPNLTVRENDKRGQNLTFFISTYVDLD